MLCLVCIFVKTERLLLDSCCGTGELQERKEGRKTSAVHFSNLTCKFTSFQCKTRGSDFACQSTLSSAFIFQRKWYFFSVVCFFIDLQMPSCFVNLSPPIFNLCATHREHTPTTAVCFAVELKVMTVQQCLLCKQCGALVNSVLQRPQQQKAVSRV